MSKPIDPANTKSIDKLSKWCHAVNDYFEQMQGGPSRTTIENREMIDLALENRDLKFLRGIRKEDKVIIEEFGDWDFTPLDDHLKKELGVGIDWSD